MTGAQTSEHDHPHPHESYGLVHGGPPVLDIGGDVGALLALMDDRYVGTELFVRSRPEGAEVHTGVWRRRLGDGEVAAAVFLELTEGSYEFRDDPWSCRGPMTIRGGELTELDLRTGG